jgi:hypothetical protein
VRKCGREEMTSLTRRGEAVLLKTTSSVSGWVALRVFVEPSVDPLFAIALVICIMKSSKATTKQSLSSSSSSSSSSSNQDSKKEEDISDLKRRIDELTEMLEHQSVKGACNDLSIPMSKWKYTPEGPRNGHEFRALLEIEETLLEAVAVREEEREALIKKAINSARRRADLIVDSEKIGWGKATERRGMSIDKSGKQCYACGQQGHFADECEEEKERRRKEKEESWKKRREEKRKEKGSEEKVHMESKSMKTQNRNQKYNQKVKREKEEEEEEGEGEDWRIKMERDMKNVMSMMRQLTDVMGNREVGEGGRPPQ